MKPRLMIVAFAMAVSMGCASWLKSFDAYNSSSDDDKMSSCRTQGREAAKDAGNDGQVGYAAYYNCTVEAGLR